MGKTTLFQFIKKLITKLLKTTVLLQFYRFVAKYMNTFFKMECFIFFEKMI